MPRHDSRQDPPSLRVVVGSLHHLIGELIQPLHVLGVGKPDVVEHVLDDELLSWGKMIKTLYPTEGQGLVNVTIYTTNSWGHGHLASHEVGVHPEDSGSLFLREGVDCVVGLGVVPGHNIGQQGQAEAGLVGR